MNPLDLYAYMQAVSDAFDAFADQLSTADILAAQQRARELGEVVRRQIAADEEAVTHG